MTREPTEAETRALEAVRAELQRQEALPLDALKAAGAVDFDGYVDLMAVVSAVSEALRAGEVLTALRDVLDNPGSDEIHAAAWELLREIETGAPARRATVTRDGN